jgi:UDP-N-acetyl-D-mannosaminuronic acid dehydrogenase/UDP-N-acetyl-D-glucosamine dehydrogenase
VSAADLVVVLTDHDALDWALLEKHADKVLDTRNRLRDTPGVDRL